MSHYAYAKDDKNLLTFGVGTWDWHHDNGVPMAYLEYTRGNTIGKFLKPMFGGLVTSDRSYYLYAGVKCDLFLSNEIVLVPTFAPGYFRKGDGKDLGHKLEFKSGVALAYRFEDSMRLSVEICHLSNAGLGNINPGTETFVIALSAPLN